MSKRFMSSDMTKIESWSARALRCESREYLCAFPVLLDTEEVFRLGKSDDAVTGKMGFGFLLKATPTGLIGWV